MRMPVYLVIAVSVVLSAVGGLSCAAEPHFAPVYQILQSHCGHCHQIGGASSWVVDMSPTTEKYPECLAYADLASQHQCTTHQQLVEVPGLDIPPWVRPQQAAMSEPYVNACVTEESFHIGVSLSEKLPDAACRMIFDWIVTGAKY